MVISINLLASLVISTIKLSYSRSSEESRLLNAVLSNIYISSNIYLSNQLLFNLIIRELLE